MRKLTLLLITLLLMAVPALAQEDTTYPVITPDNAAQLTEIAMLELAGEDNLIDDVAWSPSGLVLALGVEDFNGYLWDIAETLTPLAAHEEIVYRVAWSPDGDLATGGWDGAVLVWDVDNGEPTAKYEVFDFVYGLAWSPDGASLAAGAADSTMRVWDVESGEETAVFEEEETIAFWDIDWSPDSTLLAAGLDDGLVRVFEMETQEMIVEFYGPAAFEFAALDWSPDGAILAVGFFAADHQRVILWDTDSWDNIGQIEIENAPITDLDWSPDGALLAVATEVDIQVATLDGDVLLVLDAHTGYVSGVAFSPDGTQLATSSSDGTARVWGVVEQD